MSRVTYTKVPSSNFDIEDDQIDVLIDGRASNLHIQCNDIERYYILHCTLPNGNIKHCRQSSSLRQIKAFIEQWVECSL